MPWKITTLAVGIEDGTSYPSGEEEVGPISKPGEEEEYQTVLGADGSDGSIPITTAATNEEAGQGPKTALVGEQAGSYEAADIVNPFGGF